MVATRNSLYIHVLMVIMATLALGWVGTAGATGAATAAQKCEAAKLKASGNKAKCLLQAEARSVKSGQPPHTSECVKRFEAAFAEAERKAWPGGCPTEGDVNDIEALIDTCRDDVADALSGFPPAPCGKFPATGQTTVRRIGDDGHIQAGATLDYTDNLDGTITDNNTGLTWAKKSADGTIHDVGNTYMWENAFAVHVVGLNAANFAGHNDWRLPNVKELQSIVNYDPSLFPAISDAFKTPCVPGVTTVLTGSCTPAFDATYWSSTTDANNPTAWLVNFDFGNVTELNLDFNLHVRAVRGGSP